MKTLKGHENHIFMDKTGCYHKDTFIDELWALSVQQQPLPVPAGFGVYGGGGGTPGAITLANGTRPALL